MDQVDPLTKYEGGRPAELAHTIWMNEHMHATKNKTDS